MIRAIGPFALALLLAAPANAQQVEEGPGGPDRVSLTVYNQNIALVEDVRNLNVPAGRSGVSGRFGQHPARDGWAVGAGSVGGRAELRL